MSTVTRVMTFASVLLIAACGESGGERAESSGDHVFSTQQQALEKAKETSALLEEAAERKRKQVKEQR